MKRLLLFGLAAGLLVVGGTAMAGPWGRGMGMGYGQGPYAPGLAQVTPEKAAQLRSLQEAYLQEVTPLQTELFNKKMQLRTLWNSVNPDQTQMSALQKELLNLQGQLQEKRLRFHLEARKILNS